MKELRFRGDDERRLDMWMMFTGATKVEMLKNVIHYGLNVLEDELGLKHGDPDFSKMELFLLDYRADRIRRGKYTRCEYCHRPYAFSKFYLEYMKKQTSRG